MRVTTRRSGLSVATQYGGKVNAASSSVASCIVERTNRVQTDDTRSAHPTRVLRRLHKRDDPPCRDFERQVAPFVNVNRRPFTASERVSLLLLCTVLFSCSSEDSGAGFLLQSRPGYSDHISVLQIGANQPSPMEVVDFTGAAEIVELRPRRTGYYVKVKIGQWVTELAWTDRLVGLLIDPEANLFVSETPLSDDVHRIDRLCSAFGPYVAREPAEINNQTIQQLWSRFFAHPEPASCRVTLSRRGPIGKTAGVSAGSCMFFSGKYGGSVGGREIVVPCKYYDSTYENGDRWAVLNCPKGMFRFRWRTGILFLKLDDSGELLGMIIDTDERGLTFTEAAQAGLLQSKEPVSPLAAVRGLEVTELTGKPRLFFPE